MGETAYFCSRRNKLNVIDELYLWVERPAEVHKVILRIASRGGGGA